MNENDLIDDPVESLSSLWTAVMKWANIREQMI